MINLEFHNISVMLLPILKNYLKKTQERELVVKSGDQFLEELNKKDSSNSKASETVNY